MSQVCNDRQSAADGAARPLRLIVSAPFFLPKENQKHIQ